MGKFDGVLFFCDYDDTLYNSSRAVSPENRAAIRYFIDNGGYFSIATGRAHRTFTPQIARERLTLNAPVVLSNGAAIYDYASDRYLLESFLPKDTPSLLAQLCGQFPDLGFEAYHGEDIYVHNPNRITQEHLTTVGGTQIVAPILDMPTPWSKVILQQDGTAARPFFPTAICWRSPPRGATRGPWRPRWPTCCISTAKTSTAWGTTKTTSPCWPSAPSPLPPPTAPSR